MQVRGILEETFRGSSVVEQFAVNELVVGSNPTRGALVTKPHNLWGFVLYGLIVLRFERSQFL